MIHSYARQRVLCQLLIGIHPIVLPHLITFITMLCQSFIPSPLPLLSWPILITIAYSSYLPIFYFAKRSLIQHDPHQSRPVITTYSCHIHILTLGDSVGFPLRPSMPSEALQRASDLFRYVSISQFLRQGLDESKNCIDSDIIPQVSADDISVT